MGTFGYMSGHIRRLGQDRYLVRISCAWDPVTGKRSQPSKVVHGSRQDAELALAQLRVDYSNRTGLPSTMTIDGLIKQFLNSPTKSGRSREPGSRYREHRRYETHVQPGFGERLADSIQPYELTRLYDSLVAKGLSPSSVRLIHALIGGAFAWGVKRGFVSSNPAKRAECPSVRREPPSAPSMETVQAHLRILQEEDAETALVVRLGATIGLRRNEIAGLRWEHIDLDNGLVSITEGIAVTPGEGTSVTSTKTGQHGHGVLSIDEGLILLLKDAYERLEKTAADLGVEVPSDAYVVSRDPLHGKPINPDLLTKRLKAHMASHPGIPPFTLKDLRAFTATMLEASGADITTAQAVLRHRSGQTTMGYYRAARMDRVRGATVGLGRLIDGV